MGQYGPAAAMPPPAQLYMSMVSDRSLFVSLIAFCCLHPFLLPGSLQVTSVTSELSFIHGDREMTLPPISFTSWSLLEFVSLL